MGEPGRQGFAFFHPPSGTPAAGHALLICPSFGTEEVNAHRSLRLLAEATARAGIPTMRLDYPGCGNAEGDADTPQLVQAWQDSIVAAAQALRQLAGVERVSLLGLRLGALLAGLAAPRCGALHDFVAVAPVVSGRAFVREMKALHMASLSSLGGDAAAQAPDAPAVFESGGFVMADATHQTLAGIDLLKLDAPPVPRILLIERDDLPGPAAKWAAHLAAQGVQTGHATLTGYAAMMADPHRGTPPASLPALVIERLLQPHPDRDEPAVLPPSGIDATVHRSLALACRPGAGGGTDEETAVCEEPIFIGANPALFGILSRPGHLEHFGGTDAPGAAITRSGLAILMLNAGATRLIGPNRLYVPLARHWAAQGHAALRLDIAGLGDSAVHPGQPDNTVYSETALQDIAQALAWMRARPGVRRVVLVGLCSGAYHAFKALVNGQPADAAIMINPLTFFWKEGMSLEPGAITEASVALDMMRHRQSIWHARTWMKVLRGGISPARLAQIARQIVKAVVGRSYRAVARRLGLPLQDDLAQELAKVAARATPMHFVFADTDPGLTMLKAQGGALVDQLMRQGRLTIELVPHADHTFTLAAPRGRLQEALLRTVEGFARQG